MEPTSQRKKFVPPTSLSAVCIHESEESIVAAIRSAVTEHGCSQKDTAEALCVSPQYLHDVLRGRRRVSEALAERLGVRRVVTFVRIPGTVTRDDSGEICWCRKIPCQCATAAPGSIVDLLRQIATLRAALKSYVEWFGPAHVDGCPADDTCFCSGSAVNDVVNAALRKTE